MNRRRHRRRLAWSLGPTLVALAVAAKLLWSWWAIEQAGDAYRDAVADPARATAAVERFERADWLLFNDRAVPIFGVGAAHFVGGDLLDARRAFEDAVAEADGARRCAAVVNLVLTVETQGDELVEIDAGSGLDHYRQARDLIDEHVDCRRRTDAGRGPGDRLDRAADRLDEKLAAGVVAAPNDQRPVSPEQTQTDPAANDLDQLDQALDQNADTRSQGPELQQDADFEPPVPPRARW